jgi:inner membrane protein
MYVLGHVGITLGAALLGSGAYCNLGSLLRTREQVTVAKSKLENTLASTKSDFSLTSWTQTLGRFLDIRFLVIGSMLPDIIDKPLGHIFFNNGRVMSHTFLFVAILLIVGLIFYRKYPNKWLLALGMGSIVHLLLDEMWATPQTLFWPLYGWSFPRLEVTNWIQEWINHANLPAVYVPELVGGVIIAGFVMMVLSRKKAAFFLKKGTI